MKSRLFLSSAVCCCTKTSSLRTGFFMHYKVKGHYRSKDVLQNQTHCWCRVYFSSHQEEVNFEVTSLSLYEKLNSMQTLDHKRVKKTTLVMPWIYKNLKTVTQFQYVAQFRFSTSSPSLTCRPLTSKYVANRKRSSRTGGVNSTPRLERKTSTGRTWREASTRWR